jgi:rhomboid protease GluP
LGEMFVTDVAEIAPAHSILPDAPDTFCTYLARQFIAKRGFAPCDIREAAPLAAHCDHLLSYADGNSVTILAMVDRETHPGKTFDMSPEATAEIGRACLKRTGSSYLSQDLVALMIMEVGPQDEGQRARLSHIKASGLFSKMQPSGWIVDPQQKTVWTNARFGSLSPYKRFIHQMMTSPREQIAPPQTVAVDLTPRFPYLTVAIIAVLCAIFAAEIVFGVGPWTGMLQPSIATLIAFGGIYSPLVMQGEWFRLFSGPLLHADAMHLALNCVALYISARILEGLVGRAWLSALFIIGAISGAVFSLVFNPENLVSVGASGAVMALFAALLVLAFHFPKGADRTVLLTNSIYVLVASMVPVTSSGGKVDIAAHAGGALGGLVVGALLLMIWRRDEPHPRFAGAGAAIGLAGLAAFIFAFTPLPQNYREGLISAAMIPDSETPKNATEWRERAPDLMARYPRDPRPRYFRAIDLIDARDMTTAEHELRAGLAEVDFWRKVINPEFAMHMQVALAITLADDRLQEAREVARPTCDWATGPTRQLLDENKLCPD